MPDPLQNKPQFAIAGAGLLGSLLGWRLARQGYRVSLFEQACEDQPAAAAYTAAAMIAPWAELPVCAPGLFELGKQSRLLWPQWLAELQQQTGETVPFGNRGSLLVAHPADQSELTDFTQHMQRSGISSPAELQPVNGEQLHQLEPELAGHFQSGFWLPQESHLENRQLLPLLQRAIRQLGGQIHYDAEVRFGDADVQVNGEQVEAEQWLDCRGVGGKQSNSQVRGVRGEVLWIEAPDVVISRPVRLLHPRYHLYLVPKSAGRYILGATEIESDDRSPVSVRSALEMLSAAYALSPKLAEARIIELSSNVRPGLPSHQPEIRQIPQGLAINGLFRHGYLLAPAVLLQLQQQWQLPLDISLADASVDAVLLQQALQQELQQELPA